MHRLHTPRSWEIPYRLHKVLLQRPASQPSPRRWEQSRTLSGMSSPPPSSPSCIRLPSQLSGSLSSVRTPSPTLPFADKPLWLLCLLSPTSFREELLYLLSTLPLTVLLQPPSSESPRCLSSMFRNYNRHGSWFLILSLCSAHISPYMACLLELPILPRPHRVWFTKLLPYPAYKGRGF